MTFEKGAEKGFGHVDFVGRGDATLRIAFFVNKGRRVTKMRLS